MLDVYVIPPILEPETSLHLGPRLGSEEVDWRVSVKRVDVLPFHIILSWTEAPNNTPNVLYCIPCVNRAAGRVSPTSHPQPKQ